MMVQPRHTQVAHQTHNRMKEYSILRISEQQECEGDMSVIPAAYLWANYNDYANALGHNSYITLGGQYNYMN